MDILAGNRKMGKLDNDIHNCGTDNKYVFHNIYLRGILDWKVLGAEAGSGCLVRQLMEQTGKQRALHSRG